MINERWSRLILVFQIHVNIFHSFIFLNLSVSRTRLECPFVIVGDLGEDQLIPINKANDGRFSRPASFKGLQLLK